VTITRHMCWIRILTAVGDAPDRAFLHTCSTSHRRHMVLYAESHPVSPYMQGVEGAQARPDPSPGHVSRIETQTQLYLRHPTTSRWPSGSRFPDGVSLACMSTVRRIDRRLHTVLVGQGGSVVFAPGCCLRLRRLHFSYKPNYQHQQNGRHAQKDVQVEP